VTVGAGGGAASADTERPVNSNATIDLMAPPSVPYGSASNYPGVRPAPIG
jgi:hypothetical protein